MVHASDTARDPCTTQPPVLSFVGDINCFHSVLPLLCLLRMIVERRHLGMTSLRNLLLIDITIASDHNITCLTVKISAHSAATVDGVDGICLLLDTCHRLLDKKSRKYATSKKPGLWRFCMAQGHTGCSILYEKIFWFLTHQKTWTVSQLDCISNFRFFCYPYPSISTSFIREKFTRKRLGTAFRALPLAGDWFRVRPSFLSQWAIGSISTS